MDRKNRRAIRILFTIIIMLKFKQIKKQKDRWFLRILISPFLLIILIIAFIYLAFNRWFLFLRFGGEWLNYEDINESKTIQHIYEKLKQDIIYTNESSENTINLNLKIDEMQQMVRDLRDSDNHVCPADKNDIDICSCGEYDLIIDKLSNLKK